MFGREDRTAIRRTVAKEGTADETVDRARSERRTRRFGAWLPSVRLLVLSYHQLQNRRGGGSCFIPLAFPGEAVGLRANCQCGAGGVDHSGLCGYCSPGSFPRFAGREHVILLSHLRGVLGAGPLLFPPHLGFSCVLHLGQNFWRIGGYADLDAGE